jgi:hypothetical protein
VENRITSEPSNKTFGEIAYDAWVAGMSDNIRAICKRWEDQSEDAKERFEDIARAVIAEYRRFLKR